MHKTRADYWNEEEAEALGDAMNVYVVLVRSSYEESGLLGVFATREAAEAGIRDKFVTWDTPTHGADKFIGDEAEITEVEVRG
jgi:hypothetical protein